ncbi:hypothetical protein, partial [Bacillus subtilis]|uniref:hypothetical protein n=1 Tax=Bacillus subtilis TaxID=1423 RepID=UPI003F7B8383
MFTILLFLACGVTAAAASTVTGMKAPDYSGDFRLIPDTDNFKSPDPSFYVWETGGILGSVVGILSNMLMMSGVAILKLSILVMDLG